MRESTSIDFIAGPASFVDQISWFILSLALGPKDLAMQTHRLIIKHAFRIEILVDLVKIFEGCLRLLELIKTFIFLMVLQAQTP